MTRQKKHNEDDPEPEMHEGMMVVYKPRTAVALTPVDAPAPGALEPPHGANEKKRGVALLRALGDRISVFAAYMGPDKDPRSGTVPVLNTKVGLLKLPLVKTSAYGQGVSTVRPGHNLFAMRTEQSKLCVVDLDTWRNLVPRWIVEALFAHCTAIVETPSGFHCYFSTVNPDGSSADCAAIGMCKGTFVRPSADAPFEKQDGIDCRGASNSIIYAPPTTYPLRSVPDGPIEVVSYRWVRGFVDTATTMPPALWQLFTHRANFSPEARAALAPPELPIKAPPSAAGAGGRALVTVDADVDAEVKQERAALAAGIGIDPADDVNAPAAVIARLCAGILGPWVQKYDNWLALLICLKTVSTKNPAELPLERARELALETARRSPSHPDGGTTLAKFDSLVPRGVITVNSLHFWVRTTNPDFYGTYIVAPSTGFKVPRTEKDFISTFVQLIKRKTVAGEINGNGQEPIKRLYRCGDDGYWENIAPSKLVPEYLDVMPAYLNVLRTGALAAPASDAKKRLIASIDKAIDKASTVKHASDVTRVAISLLVKPETISRMNNPDPNLVPCTNGVVDVSDAVLTVRRPLPEEYVRGPPFAAAFDPDADTTDIAKAALQWTGAQPVADFLQTFLGYCITGHTDMKAFAIITGPTGGGKSLLTTVLGALMTQEWLKTLNKTALNERASDLNDSLYQCIGKRCGILQEATGGTGGPVANRYDTDLLKSLTGADAVPVRSQFAKETTADNTTKFLLACNSFPRSLDGTDGALVARVRVIPFHSTFTTQGAIDAAPPHERANMHLLAPELKGKLLGNLGGVLRWLLQGAQRNRANPHADPPQQVMAASAERMLANNPTKLWLSETCSLDDADARCPVRSLWEQFCADDAKIDITNRRAQGTFRTNLMNAGVHLERDHAKFWHAHGVTLNKMVR